MSNLEKVNKRVLHESFTQLDKLLEQYRLRISSKVLKNCRDFAWQVVTHNSKLNLTRLVSPRQMTISMVLDSLLFLLPLNDLSYRTIADVGSGAGFPAVPLAFALPDKKITAIEHKAGKAGFLKEAVLTLNIPNLAVLQSKAETIIASGDLKFDVVVSRALAGFKKSLRLMLPLVNPGGVVIMARGTRNLDRNILEFDDFSKGSLGMECYRYRLPGYDSDFVHIVIRKNFVKSGTIT